MSGNQSNAEIILRALMNAQRININGTFYCFDEDYRLCQIAWNQDGKETLMVVNMGDGITLSEFIKWCNELSSDTITIIGYNHILSHINR